MSQKSHHSSCVAFLASLQSLHGGGAISPRAIVVELAMNSVIR